jgi:hypothetical protein
LETCPSVGVTPLPDSGTCPAGSSKEAFRRLCIFPKTTLTKADVIDCTPQAKNCLNNNGTPQLDKYFYDNKTGWLFLYVAQTSPNASTKTGGTAPLGSCTGDTKTDPFFCPSQTGADSYYVCPPEGCWSYSIQLSGAYAPQPSACLPPYGGNPDYSQATPILEGQLAEGINPVTRIVDGGTNGKFPNYRPTAEPNTCKTPN